MTETHNKCIWCSSHKNIKYKRKLKRDGQALGIADLKAMLTKGTCERNDTYCTFEDPTVNERISKVFVFNEAPNERESSLMDEVKYGLQNEHLVANINCKTNQIAETSGHYENSIVETTKCIPVTDEIYYEDMACQVDDVILGNVTRSVTRLGDLKHQWTQVKGDDLLSYQLDLLSTLDNSYSAYVLQETRETNDTVGEVNDAIQLTTNVAVSDEEDMNDALVLEGASNTSKTVHFENEGAHGTSQSTTDDTEIVQDPVSLASITVSFQL